MPLPLLGIQCLETRHRILMWTPRRWFFNDDDMLLVQVLRIQLQSCPLYLSFSQSREFPVPFVFKQPSLSRGIKLARRPSYTPFPSFPTAQERRLDCLFQSKFPYESGWYYELCRFDGQVWGSRDFLRGLIFRQKMVEFALAVFSTV
jgi:hypothetical protein